MPFAIATAGSDSSGSPRLLGGEGLLLQFDSDDMNNPISGQSSDASGNGNNVILHSGAYLETGRHGQALVFDGIDDRSQIPASPGLNIGDDMTMLFWVRTTQTGWSADIIDKDVAGQAQGDWRVTWNAAGTVDAAFGNGCSGPANRNIADGAWHHVAMTRVRSTGTISFFIDGSAAGQVMTSCTDSVANSVDMYIGAVDCCDNTYFRGSLDELRLYPQALSLSQIWDIAQNPYDSQSSYVRPPCPQGLICWFDDFESYSTGSDASAGGWQQGLGGTPAVSTANAEASSKSLQLQSHPYSAVSIHRSLGGTTPLGKAYVEASILLESSQNQGSADIGFKAAGSQSATWVATVGFAKDGTINWAGQQIGTWSPNTWYHVRIELTLPSGGSSESSSVSLNGNSVYSGALPSTGTSYANLAQAALGTHVDENLAQWSAWFDNVQAGSASAAPTYVFPACPASLTCWRDDFESYSAGSDASSGGWGRGQGGAPSVSATQADASTKSYEIRSQPYSATSAHRPLPNTPGFGKAYVEGSVYLQPNPSNAGSADIGFQKAQDSGWLVTVGFAKDGSINWAGTNIGAWSPNTWYHVKIELTLPSDGNAGSSRVTLGTNVVFDGALPSIGTNSYSSLAEAAVGTHVNPDVSQWSAWFDNVQAGSGGSVPPDCAVSLSNPSDMATVASTPTLSWSGTSGCGSYEVQVSTSSSFSSLAASGTPTGTTWTPTNTLSPGTYYWRVRGQTQDGQQGDWSSSRSFTVPPQCTPVSLSSPVDGATVTPTPTLTWTGGSGCTGFEVQVSTSSSFYSIMTSGTPSGTSWTATTPLSPGTYYWHVRGLTSSGQPTGWSTDRSFMVPPPHVCTVSLASPSDGAQVTNRPTLSWSGTTCGSYEVQVWGSTDFLGTIPGTITGTTWTPAEVLEPATYYWRVRGTSSGQTSEWSSYRPFRVAQLPVVALTNPPEGHHLTSSPTLSWSGSDGLKVEVQVASDAGFGHIVQQSKVDGTQWTPPPLAVGIYNWHARTIQGTDLGAWSTARSFTIVPPDVRYSFGAVTVSATLGAQALVRASIANDGNDAAPSRDAKLVVEFVEDPTTAGMHSWPALNQRSDYVLDLKYCDVRIPAMGAHGSDQVGCSVAVAENNVPSLVLTDLFHVSLRLDNDIRAETRVRAGVSPHPQAVAMDIASGFIGDFCDNYKLNWVSTANLDIPHGPSELMDGVAEKPLQDVLTSMDHNLALLSVTKDARTAVTLVGQLVDSCIKVAVILQPERLIDINTYVGAAQSAIANLLFKTQYILYLSDFLLQMGGAATAALGHEVKFGGISIGSPVEPTIIDSHSRVTGVINGQVIMDIPASAVVQDGESVFLLYDRTITANPQLRLKPTGDGDVHVAYHNPGNDSPSAVFPAFQVHANGPVIVGEVRINGGQVAPLTTEDGKAVSVVPPRGQVPGIPSIAVMLALGLVAVGLARRRRS